MSECGLMSHGPSRSASASWRQLRGETGIVKS